MVATRQVRMILRYAYGVFLGFIIPGIIFMGAAAIRIMHFGLPEGDITVYGPLFLWTLVAFAILLIPLLLIRFLRKSFFHEYLVYELGGFALFSPFWIALGAEVSGDSWVNLYIEGLVGAVPFPGGPTSIDWIDIGAFLYIPITVGLILIGLFLLRPSHVKDVIKYAKIGKPEITGAEKVPTRVAEAPSTPTPSPEPAEEEIMDVEPPPVTLSNIDELKSILLKLNTPEPTITAILDAGYASTTDLVATTPEQLASVTGLDKIAAADLQMQVQKILFYGDLVS
jgi:hypothetical protein